MGLKIIRDLDDEVDYVLLPRPVYEQLRMRIDPLVTQWQENEQGGFRDLTTARPEDYIRNPVTLMRMRAGLKQKDLAEAMNVSQAYISKVEGTERVSERVLSKVRLAIQSQAMRNNMARH